MASLFSLPTYPNATSYSVQYSDPTAGDPNGINPLGPWTTLGTFTSPSDIIDSSGSQNLRIYRAAPTVTVNGTQFTYPYYQPFSVAMSDPGIYEYRLYDPQITALIPPFRDFIGDQGIPQTASTAINLDSGAGSGLLIPDGSTTSFYLADVPDALPAVVLEGSVVVVQNGKTKLLGTDYYVNWDAGQVVFATAPLANDTITISYREVTHTNRVLNSALAMAVERLGSVGISGFGTSYDNNVVVLTAALGDVGLRYIVLYIASKILNNAEIWAKATASREYKTGDFQISTAPQRVLDGMSQQTKLDYDEITDAVYRYIRTNTRSVSYGDYDSFLSLNGLLPSWTAIFLLSPYSYWI